VYEAGLAGGVKWLADHMHQRHRLTVHTAVDPQAEPAEEGVRVFLFQAVRELLLNVAQHAHTDQAWVSMSPSGQSQVILEVRDSGMGFDPASLKDRVATVGGVFGLFSIRERLELLGGRLEVHSVRGEGARMVIVAPRQRPDAYKPSVVSASIATQVLSEEAAASSSSEASSHVTRVLLADEHRIIRQGVVAMLRRRPEIRVVGEARDGEEAVRLALGMHPDVVLMDVVMPKLSGVEATRRIKAQAPDIRVIGLSMYGDGEMLSTMRDAGVETCISKTASAESLIAAVLASD
jgi:CheY-like chemotaxis protein